MKTVRVIDAHCHIYPEKIAAKAAAGTGSFYGIHMQFDGTVRSLLAAGEGIVDHYIVQSVATKPQQVSSINRFIAETVAESEGKMTGLGTLFPGSDSWEQDLQELISLGLHGVKLHADIQDFRLDDPRCMKLYEACEGRLPVLLHMGDKRFDRSNPNRLVPVLRAFPGLSVIGAHFGGYSVWDMAERLLPEFPNLCVDCSSCFFTMTDEEIRHSIHVFGVDRVLFGTDYPMWSPKPEVERLLSLGLSEEDYEKIFHENAQRVYGLSAVK